MKADSNTAVALQGCAASGKQREDCNYLMLVGVEGVGGYMH